MNYEAGIGLKHAASADAFPFEADSGERAGQRRRRIIIIALLIAAVLGAALYFFRSGDDAVAAGAADAAAEQVPSVTVVAPGRQLVEGAINATGTLAARRNLPVGVVGEGGRVVSVLVDAGDWVRQGQVLAVIDRSVQTQQTRAADAQIGVAEADARLAQSNLDRALQLVERGFVSQAEVDRLTATRDAAVARVNVARSQAAELRARNARLNIVSPADGLVLARDVEPGQTVGAGSGVLFNIAQGGQMELLARVNEAQLAQISVGTLAEVSPVGSDAVFAGEVWQVAPVIDEADRQGTARIALPFARELRPGGFASATIRSGTQSAPVLPESAIQNDDEGSFVYVVGSDNVAQRRSVTLGDVTPDGIVITEGLSGTERVVLRAGGFLNPGEQVRPVLQTGG